MCSDVYDEVTDFQVCEFIENMAKTSFLAEATLL